MTDDFTEDRSITFRCNICDVENTRKLSELTREDETCSGCGSSVRMRSIIHCLTLGLFGKSMPISEINPPRPDIVGIGMSCWGGYISRLTHKVAITNTFYHQEPKLDITNIDSSMKGSLDFIITSDVFEHVAPPVGRAFQNTADLLKPGGLLVLTVPYWPFVEDQVETTEHFPDLNRFDLLERNGKKFLRNVKENGKIQYFTNLVFHGGPGDTLEMRVFSKWSLGQELEKAGFQDITFHEEDSARHGMYWANKYSVPITARSPKKRRFGLF